MEAPWIQKLLHEDEDGSTKAKSELGALLSKDAPDGRMASNDSPLSLGQNFFAPEARVERPAPPPRATDAGPAQRPRG